MRIQMSSLIVGAEHSERSARNTGKASIPLSPSGHGGFGLVVFVETPQWLFSMWYCLVWIVSSGRSLMSLVCGSRLEQQDSFFSICARSLLLPVVRMLI